MKRLLPLKILLLVLTAANVTAIRAESWRSFTLDNDLFVGQDDGYTNGIYLSQYTAGIRGKSPGAGVMLAPLLRFIDFETPLFSVNLYTLGQTMVTPEDITREVPDPADVPYSGLLFLSNTYIHAQADKAVKYGVAIGVIGPASGAEQSQKWVHEVTGSDEPKGWDHQLHNELVFQFEPGIIRRMWLRPDKQDMDAVLLADVALGTVQTSISTSLFIRTGSGLQYTYVTPALRSTRSSNPIAIGDGWFTYAGLNARYLFRQIFVDGNTYRDSPSIELDHTQVSLSVGLTYAWQAFSMSIAIEDAYVFDDKPETLPRYGSVTFAWKLED